MSGSTKVVDLGTNRKRIFDFLLVINSNLCRISHHFGDTAAACHLFDKVIQSRPFSSFPGNSLISFRMASIPQKTRTQTSLFGLALWHIFSVKFYSPCIMQHANAIIVPVYLRFSTKHRLVLCNIRLRAIAVIRWRVIVSNTVAIQRIVPQTRTTRPRWWNQFLTQKYIAHVGTGRLSDRTAWSIEFASVDSRPKC